MILDPQQWEGQMPPSMALEAQEVDWVYYAIYWFSVVFTVAITGTMLYFVWKYRRRRGDVLHPPSDFHKLEIFWTVTPVFFIILLFHIGFKGYVKTAVAGPDALEIRVHAKQWLWEFEYPNGMREIGKLTIPVGKEVKVIMSSDDVLHSFYIPEFRIKKDAVPGMYTTAVFQTTKTGEAHVFCAEYCGTSHSGMLAQVRVVPQKEFDEYMKEGPKMPEGLTAAKWGELLFSQNGCPTCHARDGVTVSPAPNLKGKFGHQEAIQSPTETTVNVDEEYVRESIRKPQAKIVKGYTNVVMPTFMISDKQVDALVAYIKTLQ